MMIKLLSNTQEEAILRYVINNYDLENHGAARLVFCSSKEDLASLGIEVPLDCVIKVAIGIAGINQSRIECSAYERFGEDYPLAKIFYVGHYIEIMEQVDPVTEFARNYDDYPNDEFLRIMTEEENYSLEDAQHILDTIYEIEDINGITGDNGQLGYRQGDYTLVAYDYGYEINSKDQLCSDLDEVIDFYYSDDLNNYLNSLINIIGEESEALEVLENNLIDNARGYYDEEEDTTSSQDTTSSESADFTKGDDTVINIEDNEKMNTNWFETKTKNDNTPEIFYTYDTMLENTVSNWNVDIGNNYCCGEIIDTTTSFWGDYSNNLDKDLDNYYTISVNDM